MDKLIKDQSERDLTGEEVKNIVGDGVNIVAYHNLGQYNTIEELCDNPTKSAIILYESKLNFGHYCAVILHDDNTLEFFDPYGNKPDSQLSYAVYDLQFKTPFLTELINNFKGKLIYNKNKLQQFKEDVNTCGRWSSLRVRMRKMDLESFSLLFSSNRCYRGDFWVSAITFLF